MSDKTPSEIVVEETPKKKRITFTKPTKAQLLALLSATAFGAAAGATVVTKTGNKKLRNASEALDETREILDHMNSEPSED